MLLIKILELLCNSLNAIVSVEFQIGSNKSSNHIQMNLGVIFYQISAPIHFPVSRRYYYVTCTTMFGYTLLQF